MVQGKRSIFQKLVVLFNIYKYTIVIYLQAIWTEATFKADAATKQKRLGQFLHQWSKSIEKLFCIEIEITGAPINSNGPTIFVSNHLSYIDVAVVALLAPVTFVAKSSIQYWPIFGSGARAIGTVFVNRTNKESRDETAQKIANALIVDKKNIMIFPAGTSGLPDIAWRYRSFEVAQLAKVPVQAFRICYFPVRETAYQGEDVFFPHLWRLLDFPIIKLSVEIREPLIIENVEKDSVFLHDWCQQSFHKKLREFGWEPARTE